jgi:hypothetical protein
MFGDNEWNYGINDHKLVPILGLLFITVILVTMCILSAILITQQKEPLPTPQPAIPAVLPLTGPPANVYSTYLPLALSAPVSEPTYNWKVTKIDNLGYELQGQRYDLAAFTRSDGQVTLQGYCINRGWDVPPLGTEYSLNADNIFVPLQEPEGNPLQRFARIQ